MKPDNENGRKMLSDLQGAEGLIAKVQALLQSDPPRWDEADAMLSRATSVIKGVRSHPAYTALRTKESGGAAAQISMPAKTLSRYQVTASIYHEQHPENPGLIEFELVNYGYDGSELSGLVEIYHEEEPELSDRIRRGVRRLAEERTLALSAEAQPDWQSGKVPLNWRVSIATGSKTDFILWVEVEIMDADGGYTTVRSGHLQGFIAKRLEAEWNTIFTAIMAKNPPLLSIEHMCSSCGSEWEEGAFKSALECPECGGFAKERPCICEADCREIAIRDSASSHANHAARTFPCAHKDGKDTNWTGDPWAIEALARKLQSLAAL
jgi:predicted RNA-binding Zn-ribbon protein involved in translation (DUF1610 family)